MKPKKTLFIWLVVIVMNLSVGCTSSSPGGNPADIAEAYLRALAGKDVSQAVIVSCNAWEDDARLELDSFASNDLKLEGGECKAINEVNGIAQVNCQGSLIASYGAEDLVIDLTERTYLVIAEAGEWRVCGYK